MPCSKRTSTDSARPTEYARQLFHDRNRNPVSRLGCQGCPHVGKCGSLNVRAAIWNCLDFCCGTPRACDRVCRNNQSFVEQFNEVGGFSLLNVAEPKERLFMPASSIVPTVYHSASRNQTASSKSVCLRLSDLYSFKSGKVRFDSREELCRSFRIREDAEIILSGVDHDRRIEPWWRLGERRQTTITGLRKLDIDLVTTPNFSMILDRPRMDDLHSMKRIAIVHEEFSRFGLPAAIHVNGRTDRDFKRWSEFLAQRPTIHQIAFEFSTGNGRSDRLPLYLDWLSNLPDAAGRPLDIFVRGNPTTIPVLRGIFRRVCYIETTSFMRTTKRRQAVRLGNQRLTWQKHPTKPGDDLASLF